MSRSGDDEDSSSQKRDQRDQSMTYSAVTARNFRQKRKHEIDDAQTEVEELQRKHSKLNTKLHDIRDEVYKLRENLASISNLLTESDLVQQIDTQVRPCVLQYFHQHFRVQPSPVNGTATTAGAAKSVHSESEHTDPAATPVCSESRTPRARRLPTKFANRSEGYEVRQQRPSSAGNPSIAPTSSTKAEPIPVTSFRTNGAVDDPCEELVITMQYKIDRDGNYYSQVLPIKWQTKADGSLAKID